MTSVALFSRTDRLEPLGLQLGQRMLINPLQGFPVFFQRIAFAGRPGLAVGLQEFFAAVLINEELHERACLGVSDFWTRFLRADLREGQQFFQRDPSPEVLICRVRS